MGVRRMKAFLLFASAYDESRELLSSLASLLGDPALASQTPEQAARRFSPERLLEELLSHVLRGVREGFSLVLPVLSVLLLLSILSRLKESLPGRLGGRFLSLPLALSLLSLLFSLLKEAKTLFFDLAALSRGAAPLLSGLLLAGGNASGAAVSGVGMGLVLFLLEEGASGILFPLIVLSAFALLLLSLGGRTEGLLSSLHKTFLSLCGVFGLLLGMTLAFSNAIGSAADSALLRTLKYALGGMIPYVGGTISASLSVAGEGVAFTRSVAGGGMLVALLSLTLPFLFSLLSVKWILSLFEGLLPLMPGEADVPRLLRGTAHITDMLLSALSLALLLFVLLLSLFIKTAAAAGGGV